MKDKNKLQLTYYKSAQDNHYGWENESLPLGNGSMGCCIFGGVEKERIQFNEKSLWNGGPCSTRPDYRGGNKKDKHIYFKQIQEHLGAGRREEALALLHQLEGSEDGYGAYQCFGDIYIESDNEKEEVTDYRRDLDITSAKATVSYKSNGISYNREYFMSFPNHLFVAKYTATGDNNLNFRIRMKSAHEGTVQPIEVNLKKEVQSAASMLRGKLADNEMIYEAIIGAYSDSGVIENQVDGSIKITGANEVIILMTAGTDYKCEYPTYRGEDPHQKVSDRIKRGLETSYEELYNIHVKDYQDIFNRVTLELGDSNEKNVDNIETNKLIDLYKKDETSNYLEVLLFQYGRYLTIASSRDEEGALPSNLQGVWNDSKNPAWGGDYHLNINLQMNYWPTLVANMQECAIPLIDYVDSLRVPGRITAEEYMGIKSTKEKPENGFMVHTQNTIFGWTCPGWDFYWGWSPAATPWIIQNIWQYYEFTRDKDILSKRIYPIMKESAVLYQQCLVWDEKSKRMVSSPSYSPEHGPVTVGNTYEQAIIYQLYKDTIKAAKILDVDHELVKDLKDTLSKLDPIHIGSDGQIKEWYEETNLGSMELIQEHHRHISHLIGLYPGDLITEQTPEWLDAAKVSLLDRGDESTGWSMGHKLNAWARTKDGEHAYTLIKKLLKNSILNNLWDTHPPFQIDGNFAATSGIAEMLLQSHEGFIELLPALPKAWERGRVIGLVARGGFVINMTWKDSKVTELKVDALMGGSCSIKRDPFKNYSVKDDLTGKEIEFEEKEGMLMINTVKGKKYVIASCKKIDIN